MKKRDLVLDFTSLLDVIMIILFVVITSVGQTSIDAKNELQSAKEEKTAIKTVLAEGEKEKQKLKEEQKSLMAELETVSEELSRLSKENNVLKAASNRTDIDPAKLYESLMRKSEKFTIICLPFVGQSEKDEVEVKLYSGEAGKEQEALASVIFEHDFSLSSEERNFKNKEMQERLYQILDRNIKNSDISLILFMVQYTYGDKNFSQSDLDIIDGAIKDIELRRNKTCFVDRVKQ